MGYGRWKIHLKQPCAGEKTAYAHGVGSLILQKEMQKETLDNKKNPTPFAVSFPFFPKEKKKELCEES